MGNGWSQKKQYRHWSLRSNKPRGRIRSRAPGLRRPCGMTYHDLSWSISHSPRPTRLWKSSQHKCWLIPHSQQRHPWFVPQSEWEAKNRPMSSRALSSDTERVYCFFASTQIPHLPIPATTAGLHLLEIPSKASIAWLPQHCPFLQ